MTGINLAFSLFEVLSNMTPRHFSLNALKTMALICWVLVMSPSLHAQTRWPVLQSSMYPYVDSMLLTRHEQTVLLGEGNQQTGIFFATLPESHSEQVHNELIGDALLKNWQLHSLMRLGTSYVVTLTQDDRILDIRLTNTTAGVDAVYSVLLNQRGNRPSGRESASND